MSENTPAESQPPSQIVWKEGEYYSWEILTSELSGDQNFLPKREGRITCARLNADINPQAPEIMVVGTKPGNVRRAEEYCTDPFPLPVFIKEASSRYRYCGYFIYQCHTDDPEVLKQFDKAGRVELSRVIFMKRVEANRLSDPATTIAPSTFDRLYKRFRAMIEDQSKSRESFVDFRSGLANEWEGYKEKIRNIAMERLGAELWNPQQIGSGSILQSVINAIEIKNSNTNRNNLVAWESQGRSGGSVSHHRMLEARESLLSCRDAETALFQMYGERGDPEKCFDTLVSVFGRRYDLIAYLFFLRDSKRYLPLRPDRFSTIFEMLGIPYSMSMQCSWENYQGFLQRIRAVHWHLKQRVPDASFLDAHSFCWMLFQLEDAPEIDLPVAGMIEIQPEAGIKPPLAETSSVRTLEDLDACHKRQRCIGDTAQTHVMKEEQCRLLQAGRADLAARVEEIGHRNISLGYDIESFTADGCPRKIEVKAVAVKGDNLRFFLSENELRKSRELEGYVFALVLGVYSNSPSILTYSGDQLPSGSLHPTDYEVWLKNPTI